MSRNGDTTFRLEKVAYRIQPADVALVLCHRRISGREQYLVRWRTEPALPVPPRAILSWHHLEDLTLCMHLVQDYLDQQKIERKGKDVSKDFTGQFHLKRKRESHDGDVSSRDSRLGSHTTSLATSLVGRSSSVASQGSSSDVGSVDDGPLVYNGLLERKEGWITAKRSKRINVVEINATQLPTRNMREQAASTGFDQAQRFIRLAFEKKVSRLPRLRIENNVDGETPSLRFRFIQHYVPGKDVYRADPDSFEGCIAPCRANMGNHMGCEWPRECKCLEYAAVNEDALQKQDPRLFLQYQEAKEMGNIDAIRHQLPKRFPYLAPRAGENRPQTLVQFYREERHPIYECNVNCRCGPACKSRVVQRGRKVPLTIFKTPNRGWGVYCDEDLIQGEFLDTYLGEIISNTEADRREQSGSKDKQSYLYSLDKFVDEVDGLTADNCYVVDGQDMGGPTRFINHSCEPNCRQYTVSYNKNDPRIYDLAFFAVEDIRAGTELTFDYQDKDEVEEEDAIRQRDAALRDPANAGKVRCNCGAKKCRGFLWD